MIEWKQTVCLFTLLVLFFCVCAVFSCGDDDDDVDEDNTGEETWTDSSTGLIWQNGTGVGQVSYAWDEVESYCGNLNWSGYNDWRLPTISELRSLITGCDDTQTGGSCQVTDSCLDQSCWNTPCSGCEHEEFSCCYSLTLSGCCAVFWSSSEVTNGDDAAWAADFSYGSVNGLTFDSDGRVRCVR